MTETATATDFLVLGQKDGPGPHKVNREGLVTVVLEQNGSIPINWTYQGKLDLLSDTTLRGRDMPGAPSAHAWLIAVGEPERTQLEFVMNDNQQETLTFEIHVD